MPKSQDLIGKILLVGLTYQTPDQKNERREQFWGTVTEANRKEIAIVRVDGQRISLPPDYSAICVAERGIYTLRATGEKVENPDFIATWVIIS